MTLYEAQDRLGGHAHTHDIVSGDGRVLALDSGFLVHNTRTYPHLIRLFAELGVATRDTEMTMLVRCEGCGLECAWDVQLRDYREAAGSHYVVLSVEMIEAVGERYWPAYFTAIDRLLAPGGRAGL